MALDSEKTRTRTVSWDDPLPALSSATSMSGLQFLEAMQRGELPHPPIMRLMGIDLVNVSEGRVVFTVTPEEYHYNPIGTVHGGLLCTILDSAMACAVHSTLPLGAIYTSLEMKVNFVRALRMSTGPLLATGTTIHVGKRVATAEGHLHDEGGNLYGHATTTCLIFRDESERARP